MLVKIIVSVLFVFYTCAFAENINTNAGVSSDDTVSIVDTLSDVSSNDVSSDDVSMSDDVDDVNNDNDVSDVSDVNDVNDSDTVAVGMASIHDDDFYEDFKLDLADIDLDSIPLTIKPNLFSRDHNFRRQTRLATVMMIFIAVAMATSQSWNPGP